MAGGADQRLHVGRIGRAGGGGKQSSAHLHSITLFLIRQFREKSACTQQRRNGEILFILGETQNERANAGRSQPSSRADGGSLAGVLLLLSGLGGPG